MVEKTVVSFAELKAAVEDADTTEIKLGADIAFSGGIRIPVAKKSLVIDGGGYTVTDNNSTSYADAIYVPAGGGAMTVTVENVNWSGRNYYGVVCVYDDTANANVTVVLSGITYKGPQMIYNRYGTTIVRNCTVSIEKNGSSASSQEFCEGNRLIFEGKVNIDSTTTATAVVWFPFAGAAFTVSENAAVTINALGTYMFYTDSAAKPVFTFKTGSTTEITTKNGLFYAAGTGAHIASSCTIESNAILKATATANNGVPLFKCSGNLTVESGGSLFLSLPASGSSAAAYFSTAAKINFNSPKNVLLYANGGKAFSFATGSASAPNTVSISAEQANDWLVAKTPFASAGGFDDTPYARFSKADGQNVSITQNLSSNAVLSTESNLVQGDEGYPISTSNFDLTKVAVLSLGALDVSVDKITDLAQAITGSTDGAANVKYADSRQTASGSATQSGSFSLPVSEKPIVGDVATVSSNKNFLTTTVKATVFGSVSVTSLPDIPFNAFAVPKRSAVVKRINPDWTLELTDTRQSGGKWELYLSLKTPLKTTTATVEDAVVFFGDAVQILDDTPVSVASGTTDKAGKISVSWPENKGIVLVLDDEKEYEKGDYSSTLEWGVDFE